MDSITMPIALRRTRFVARDVDKYEEEQKEAWKQEHEQAQLCFDIHEIVLDGNRIYEDIIRIDEYWRLTVYRSPELYVAEFDTEIESLLSRWHANSIRLLELYDTMEAEYVSRDFDVALVNQLKRYVAECDSILSPFTELPENLVLARDAAISEHLAGETVEIGSFRD